MFMELCLTLFVGRVLQGGEQADETNSENMEDLDLDLKLGTFGKVSWCLSLNSKRFQIV